MLSSCGYKKEPKSRAGCTELAPKQFVVKEDRAQALPTPTRSLSAVLDSSMGTSLVDNWNLS
jgi:hypothetical protein